MSHPFNAFSSSGISSAALSAALAVKLDAAGGTMTGALAINAGTLATAGLTHQQTWNSGGTQCRGLEVKITNTAASSSSTFFRVCGGAAGTTELFGVNAAGWITGPASGTMVIAPAAGNNLNLYPTSGGSITANASLSCNGGITMLDGMHFSFGTSSGMKLGTATSQKLGFWNATPVVQPSHIADPSGGAVVDAEARTAINAILAWQATLGLTAAS